MVRLEGSAFSVANACRSIVSTSIVHAPHALAVIVLYNTDVCDEFDIIATLIRVIDNCCMMHDVASAVAMHTRLSIH